MPRQIRIEYEGALYHLLNRGEAIFRDDVDRRNFLAMLGRTCARTGWQVHACCFMSNHFHLVVATARANLWRNCPNLFVGLTCYTSVTYMSVNLGRSRTRKSEFRCQHKHSSEPICDFLQGQKGSALESFCLAARTFQPIR